MTITLYGFGRIFPEGRGETKDLWVQWALEEVALPYRVHALDHTGGELDREPFTRISPFHQAPVIDDDGFTLSESSAIVLYLAEKAGKLIPADPQGRSRVTQWCFAAVATVMPTLSAQDILAIFGNKDAHLESEVGKLAARWLGDVDRHLQGRTWIATDEFTVADVVMAGVLRMIRKTEMLKPFPQLLAYYERCFARPAWGRALAMYAERVGVTVDDIR
jgi:glutathione S-transferase